MCLLYCGARRSWWKDSRKENLNFWTKRFHLPNSINKITKGKYSARNPAHQTVGFILTYYIVPRLVVDRHPPVPWELKLSNSETIPFLLFRQYIRVSQFAEEIFKIHQRVRLNCDTTNLASWFTRHCKYPGICIFLTVSIFLKNKTILPSLNLSCKPFATFPAADWC